MEIITGVERRRRWSSAKKLRIVAETEQSGLASTRLHGVMRSAVACYGTGEARCAGGCSLRNGRLCFYRCS